MPATRPRPRPRRGAALGSALAILLVVPSCGGPKINPPGEVARAALEAALAAWRDGKKPAELAQADPPIQVVDGEWTGGRKLAGFEILREAPADSDKRFAVKLTYPGSTAPSEVVYVVLGAHPVAVFREEDFARTMNMDNNPTSKKKKR